MHIKKYTPQNLFLLGAINATKYALGYDKGQFNRVGLDEPYYGVSRRGTELLRISGLYCIERISKEDKFIMLNREYKPIGCGGFTWEDWADYYIFPNHIFEGNNLTDIFSKVAEEVHKGTHWYFYNDLTAPHGLKPSKKNITAYLEKLELFERLMWPESPSDFE